MKQKWFILLALVTVASLLLASCGPAAGGAVIKVATQSPIGHGPSIIHRTDSMGALFFSADPSGRAL